MSSEAIYTEYGPVSGCFSRSRLGDLCVPDNGVQTGPFGSQLHASEYVSKGTPIITVEHLGENRIIHSDLPYVSSKDKERLAKYTLRTGDIVFSRVGSVDRRAFIRREEEGWLFSGRCLRVRPDSKKINPAYLSWFLGLPGFKEHIQQIAVGATMPSLNTAILKNVFIYYPSSLREQRAIANILGTLDDKIELNRRMNETLEAIARAIFESWFVDFDPVTDNALRAGNPIPSALAEKAVRCREMLARAKADHRDSCFPNHIAKLLPGRFADSELGPIPEGWEVKKLSELCSTQYGFTASATEDPIGPKLLRVKDINKRNWIEWNEVPYCVIEQDLKKLYALKFGDIVVARMADPGKSAIIEEDVDAVFASYLVRLKAASLAQSYYIYGFLKSDSYSDYAEAAKSGSVQASMNAKVIVGVDLVIPPKTAIEKFVHTILPLRYRLVANVRESCTLAALRDALLPDLISGELGIKDAHRIISEVP